MIRYLIIFVVGVLVISLIINTSGSAFGVVPEDIPTQRQAAAITNYLFANYLPLIFRSYRLPSIFGVETTTLSTDTLSKATFLHTYWMRYFTFDWESIEPTDVDPSQFNWGAVNETQLIEASSRGYAILATVRNTPDWAQKISDPNSIPCSPVNDDAGTITEFQEFIQAIATRYSAAPYNIQYWQLGNEPDVTAAALGDTKYWSPFGCWGDATDPYYGGEYYGKFLKIFSETIKSVNPSAKITNGGLLLDCHPVNDAPNCPEGNFFEGIIKFLYDNNSLNALDYASFHSYTRWISNLRFFESWKGFTSQGGALLGKSYFLREVMSNYGINPTIPLLVTEGGTFCRRGDTLPPLPSGVKCSDPIPPPEFSDDQAEFVVWLYVQAISDDISGVMWYTLEDPGWAHAGLLYSDGTPKPVYFSYKFLASQVANASYIGKLNQYFPDLRAYDFMKGSQHLWILWAPDQIDHPISQPPGLQAMYDLYGNSIQLPPQGGLITINSPVYLIVQ